jgi:hypothetical protein
MSVSGGQSEKSVFLNAVISVILSSEIGGKFLISAKVTVVFIVFINLL